MDNGNRREKLGEKECAGNILKGQVKMKQLKEIRQKAGLTQGELSKALGFTTPQYISNCERGLSVLCARHFKPIAKLCKVKVEVLVKARVEQFEQKLRGAI